ncbi:phospholipase A2, minor isoenzyme-like [Ascaphus truei]|uniref:phospholipase A2, minor isoenzyme-like n=1 Tax=Ascaphus truei TaxID=8439 RepID=UPI003F59A6B6
MPGTRAALLLLLTVSAVSARPQSRNLLQFRQMIKCAMPDSKPVSEFNQYGCYCGLGGSGKPMDDLDTCCQTHDNCYGASKQLEDCIPIFDNPYTEIYTYTCTDNLPTCSSKNKPCEAHICECDRNAAVCFSRASYNEGYKNLDKKKHCQ